QSGESRTIGVFNYIRWNHNLGTAGETDAFYTLSISYDSGATWQGLNAYIHADAFKAQLAMEGPATTHARVRIDWSDGVTSARGEGTDFTIVPNIHVTSPNTSVTW